MYDEDDLLPISALQHLAFCPRQCALIYVEGLWAENRLTTEGKLLHERTHLPQAETRRDLRTVRGLRLHCLRLGLVGQADVVEFHRAGSDTSAAEDDDPLAWLDVPGDDEPQDDEELGTGNAQGVEVPGLSGLWRPFPVEYKRGKVKPGSYDEVQLCAQALCLEEMLRAVIPRGALYYGQPRRRQPVGFTRALREETEAIARRLHELVGAGVTPPARREPKCRGCSMLDHCLPSRGHAPRSARNYLATAAAEALREEVP
jgi:CRISPR-associated exonuclease Cas4